MSDKKIINGKFKKGVLSLLTVLTIFSFTSCAKKITFLVSPIVPAARGYVKVTRDQNKNYIVNIDLLDLAEVERLVPSKKVYVIWMVSDKDITINLGQIKSSENNLTKKLKATFKTVTAFKPTKIFITAEENSEIQYPEAQVILSTDRF